MNVWEAAFASVVVICVTLFGLAWIGAKRK